MVDAGWASRFRGLVEAARQRVRLRTRLRRIRDTWRRLRPRQLPPWSDPEPTRVETMEPARFEVTVPSVSAVRQYAAGADLTVQALRLVVTDWRTPYPGWQGRLGPLPGLVEQEVCLPGSGRGTATVTVALDIPLPVRSVLTAACHALAPARPPDPAAGTDQEHRPAMVDATTANPRGRDRNGPRQPPGRLSLVPGPAGVRWEVVRVTDGVPVVAGRAGEPLDDRQRAVLAALGVVEYAEASALPPAVPAQVLAQLAMTGVLLHAPELPDRLLAAELAELVRAPLPDRRADPLAWELRSVRQRRAAIRHHAAGLVGAGRPPPVSAVLVTKRPGLVGPAVAALAAQTYPELEVVVGLHGCELPPGLENRPPGPVVPIPADLMLGEALATATQAASGRLITKVDDDDRYGPEHVWDLVQAWHYSAATVVGKGSEFVYLEPKDVTVQRRMGAEFYTDTVAGGTITLASEDLSAAGGWPPVPRWVDRALLDRVLAAGGLVYRTHPYGFIYTRHGHGHTWDADLRQFTRDPLRRWNGLPLDQEFGTA